MSKCNHHWDSKMVDPGYRDCLICKVEELEAQGAVDRATCRWCGTIHARKMNILCPLTIAEAKLDAVNSCQRYIDLGGGSIQESPTGEYMLTSDVLKAIGEQNER